MHKSTSVQIRGHTRLPTHLPQSLSEKQRIGLPHPADSDRDSPTRLPGSGIDVMGASPAEFQDRLSVFGDQNRGRILICRHQRGQVIQFVENEDEFFNVYCWLGPHLLWRPAELPAQAEGGQIWMILTAAKYGDQLFFSVFCSSLTQ